MKDITSRESGGNERFVMSDTSYLLSHVLLLFASIEACDLRALIR